MRFAHTLFLIVLAAARTAASQETSAQLPPYTQEIVVVAERAERPRAEIAASVSILTREEIERLPATNLGELIGHLPGVTVLLDATFAGAPIVSTRGFFGGGEVETIRLLIDGAPRADLESGLADWQSIPASEVERIEMLRGPGSSVYGDAAMGGVIHVFLADPSRGGSISLSTASHDSHAASLSHASRAGGFELRLGGSFDRTDGFRRHGGTEHRRFELQLDRNVSFGRWNLHLESDQRDRDEPGALSRAQLERDRRQSDPLHRFDRSEADRVRAVFELQHDSGLRAVVWGESRDAEILRTIPLAPGLGDRAFRRLDSEQAGLSLDHEGALGPHRLHLGLETARGSLDTDYASTSDGAPGATLASASGRRESLAGFATADWRLARRLRLTSGVRWDWIDDQFGSIGRQRHSATSPRLGLLYTTGGETPLAVYLQLSRSFKAPTLDQLFDPRPFPDFQGGTFTISNPDLEPQRAEHVEMGISRAAPRFRGSLVVYRMDVENEIDFDLATFRYENLGESRHDGLELGLELRPSTFVRPSISYSWSRVRALGGGSRGQLKNVPEHHLRAALDARLPAGLEAQLTARWIGGRYLDDENRFPLDDAVVLDTRLRASLANWRFSLDLMNLTDDEWSAYGFLLFGFDGSAVPYELPAPGRTARLVVTRIF